MNFNEFFYEDAYEKPLDRCAADGGYVGIFRRIACIGDSLSSGEFESSGEWGESRYHDYYDYSWGQYIARMAGCEVLNFSAGGMTAKEYVRGGNGVSAFADRKNLWDKDKACQAYIIALGCNDMRVCDNVGEIGDVDFENRHNNKESFVGDYAQIISRYKEISPNAKFFLMTLPRENRADAEVLKRDEKHAELMYALAKGFTNTYVLDLRKYAPVYDSEFKAKFYNFNHMNAAGYLFTAKMVASYIDYIIRHNMDDFKQAGFILTPYYSNK